VGSIRRVSEMYAPRSRSLTKRLDLADAGLDQLLDARRRENLVRLGNDLAGRRVDHVVGEDLAVDILARNAQPRDARVLELTHVPRRDATALLDDHLIADTNLEGRRLAAQTLRNQMQSDLVLAEIERVLIEERVEDLGLIHAECAQDDRHRELAAAVDAREHAVLRIELEVEP
jgi:hypothetical protein